MVYLVLIEGCYFNNKFYFMDVKEDDLICFVSLVSWEFFCIDFE